MVAMSRGNATFARDAVYAEFRGRDARAIDWDDFEDRKPSDPARPLIKAGHQQPKAATQG